MTAESLRESRDEICLIPASKLCTAWTFLVFLPPP
jgi:hypothetical protein